MRWPIIAAATKGLGARLQAAPAPPSAAPGSRYPGPAQLVGIAAAARRVGGPSRRSPRPIAPTRAAPRRSDRRAGRARRAARAPPSQAGSSVSPRWLCPPPTPARPGAELPAYFRNQPPLRHVTPRPIVEHAPLTEATDDYVGEPTAPAPLARGPQPPPPQSPSTSPPAPIRPDPAAEATTEAGARFREALANLHKSGHPRYESPSGMSDEPPSPAQARAPETQPEPEAKAPVTGMPARPRPSDAASSAPLTHRRNTLAQSRRLGLGVPFKPDESPGTAEAPAAMPPAAGLERPADLAAALAQAQAEQARQEQAFVDKVRAGEERAERERREQEQRERERREQEQRERERREQEQRAREQHAEAQHEQRGTGTASTEPVAGAPGPAGPAGDETPPTSVTAPAPSEIPGRRHPGGGEAPAGPAQLREPLRTAPTVRPITDGTARPTASTAPLRFRAAARPVEVVVTEPAPRAPQRAVVTRPPTELAQALRSSHGIDVADVEVRRDSAVAAEASARRARAFTRGATVHLPESAGPLTAPQVRGLLAHELMHAAQQRRLGGSLPAEHTAEGRALEAEAIDAEQAHGGTAQNDLPLRHAPRPVSSAWVEDRLTQHALDLGAPPMPWPLSDEQVNLVKYTAQEFIRQQVADGTLGGSGSGSGTPGTGGIAGGALAGGVGGAVGNQAAQQMNNPTIGNLQARTPEEYQTQLLGVLNMQRTAQGLEPLRELDPQMTAQARAQYDAARVAQALAGPGRSQGTMTWSPERGFQAVEAPTQGGGGPTIGGHRARGAGPDRGPQRRRRGRRARWPDRGRGPDRGCGRYPAWRPRAQRCHRQRAELAAAAVGAAGSRSPVHVDDPGIGSLHAQDWPTFRAQMLGAINMRLPDGHKKADFTHEEELVVWAQWERASAAHRDQMVGLTLQSQGRVIAQQQREAAASQTGADGASTPSTPGTPGGGQPPTAATQGAGQGQSALQHPHNEDMIDVDKLDVEELVTRIYDRVRSRLRNEFLIDRERAGLLTDFR